MRTATPTRGFTLIELVMVLILVGILSATAIPRLIDRKVFDARGFFDQSISMLRYAQKVAIAQRRDVYVNVDAGAGKICLTYAADATCTSAASNRVNNPADQSSFSKVAPTGSSFGSSTSFAFTALGRPNPNSAVVITITGDSIARTIRVEAETGYVH